MNKYLFIKMKIDENVYLYSIIYLLLILLFIKSKKITKQNIFNYINKNINDLKFRTDIINLSKPRVGEVVKNFTKPWYGLSGYITRVNNNNSYNLKITKSLNPNISRIPKKKIIKFEQECKLV